MTANIDRLVMESTSPTGTQVEGVGVRFGRADLKSGLSGFHAAWRGLDAILPPGDQFQDLAVDPESLPDLQIGDLLIRATPSPRPTGPLPRRYRVTDVRTISEEGPVLGDEYQVLHVLGRTETLTHQWILRRLPPREGAANRSQVVAFEAVLNHIDGIRVEMENLSTEGRAFERALLQGLSEELSALQSDLGILIGGEPGRNVEERRGAAKQVIRFLRSIARRLTLGNAADGVTLSHLISEFLDWLGANYPDLIP